MQEYASKKTESWLVWFLRGLAILGFLVLIARLVDLQIIKGSYYRTLAEGNRIKRIPIVAPRGRILARGGEVLVQEREVKRRVVFNSDSGFEKIEDTQNADESEIITEWLRYYPEAETFAHLTGYLGEVSQEEVGKVRGECPEKGPRRLGAWVGRGGLEENYECILSGIDGEELVEVDAQNRKVRTLGRKSGLPGKDLKTTIDYGLQKKIREVFPDKRGAVVVTNGFGEVLALYSSPSFDPNYFLARRNNEKISQYLASESKPLLNRAISGRFHPGSTFKPIVAIAGLEEGKIDENYTYEDTGKITINTPYGNFSYLNWFYAQYGGKEGKIGLVRAIARSTDTFFYSLGELLGAETLGKWASIFGLDRLTGIDLPGEIVGLVPTPSWKLQVKGEKWFLGNTYHFSIGQGDLAITPIALNLAISAIANGGSLCKPHIAQELVPRGAKCREIGLDAKSVSLVKEGMVSACSKGGTGYTFFDFEEKSGIKVGCKTGTAETEGGNPHAWFTAFAPVDKPEIVATILVENGGEGSRVAGPIARQIFDYWFKVSPKTISVDD